MTASVGTHTPDCCSSTTSPTVAGRTNGTCALNNIGLLVEEDYDVYYTNGPSSGVGNGIGGRTNDLVLAGYDDILYTSGNLGVNTICQRRLPERCRRRRRCPDRLARPGW